MAIFEPGADLSQLEAEMDRAAVAKWGKVPKGLKKPIRLQSSKECDGFYPDDQGAKFANFATLHRPGVVDEAVQPIMDKSEFFSGCYAIASVRGRAYEYEGSKGVSLDLLNIQKVATGEPLGGERSKPEDDFTAVEGSGATASDFV